MPIGAQDMPSTMTAQGEGEREEWCWNWWREVIEAHHTELADKYQAEDYIQHNPNIPTGRAAFVKFFSSLGPPVPIPDRLPDPPAVAFGKGDYVVLVWNHSAAVDPSNLPGPIPITASIASVSRTAKCRNIGTMRRSRRRGRQGGTESDETLKMGIVPHRNGGRGGGLRRAVCATGAQTFGSGASGRTLAIATRELKDMLQYNHLEIANETMADSYIQHNPNVPNGREGFVKFFGSLPNRQPECRSSRNGRRSTDPDHHQRPLRVLHVGPEGEGSGRSVEGIHLGPL